MKLKKLLHLLLNHYLKKNQPQIPSSSKNQKQNKSQRKNKNQKQNISQRKNKNQKQNNHQVMNKIQKTLIAVVAVGALYGGYAHFQLLQKVDQMEIQRMNDATLINSLVEKNDSLLNENDALKENLQVIQDEKTNLEAEFEQAKRSHPTVSRGSGRSIDVEVTAYTDGGNTATGFNLSDKYYGFKCVAWNTTNNTLQHCLLGKRLVSRNGIFLFHLERLQCHYQ